MNLKKILNDEKIDYSEFEKHVTSHLVLTITDLDGSILYATQQFLELMGYDMNEVMGKNHSMFKSASHSFTFYETLWKTIRSKQVWRGAILNKTKKGKKIWLKTTIFPIVKNDTVTHFVSVRNNITESVNTTEMLVVAQNSMKNHNLSLEKELEKNQQQMKLQKLSAIGELASKMSHDMRNPLSVIRITLENIMSMYEEKPELEKSFQRINRAIDRMAHQIDDVLDFVREKPIKKETFVLSDIIPEILSTLEIPTTINLNISLGEIKIQFDKMLFDVLIKNLVTNAIQACGDDGQIKIHAKTSAFSVMINIEDSGPEIQSGTLEKIFDPLFTTKQTGTGLGLSSCKTIIEQHGGTINVKTDPTTFTIIVPKKI